MASMYSSRCSCASCLDTDEGRPKTTTSGWMRKISGKMAIVAIM
jgi:hypothetical protein